MGAAATELVRSPDFARLLVRRAADGVVVDLVRDRAPQLLPKVSRDGIRLDDPREIAANKLTALADRAEPRDLADLRALLAATGATIDDVLAQAAQKSPADPATLAWVPSTTPLAATDPPEGTTRDDLLAFRAWLEAELRHRAAPPR